MHVQPHVAVRGVDEHIIRAARQLQMSVRLKFGCLSVVDHAVGAKDVILVMHHHIAGQRQGLAGPYLLLCFPLHGRSGYWLRFRRSHGNQFLIGIVWDRSRI